ncbi:MAG: response regulator transcription factor [Clostridiales bacterium]|nr:response regulator transcription factor [Clostridiales bacterium]
MAFRILAVDDEPLILKGLRFSLEQDGYIVEEALDGQSALDMIQSTQYDLILLDVMLPVVSGTDVLRQMREFTDTPVIMLTAKGDDMDRILGLEYGADDYMVKPFNILEVKARIKSVLRRTQIKTPASNVIQFKNLIIDPTARSCARDGIEINLTVKEFNLLMTLAQEPSKVFSREQLHQALWKNEKADGKYDLRTVDVHIRRLREKIEEDPARPSFIMTKWGVGYYFADR